MSHLTFTKNAASFILKAFGYHFNEKDEVIDEYGTRALSPSDRIITKDNFIGVIKHNNKTVFLTSVLEIFEL